MSFDWYNRVRIASLTLIAALPACGDDGGDATTDSPDPSTDPTVASTETGTSTVEDPTTDPPTGTSTEDPTTEGPTTEDPTTGEPAGEAKIRVVHAAADAPAVDIYVAGQAEPVISGLAYGEASAYLPVPAGDYDFEVRAAGSPAGDPAVYSTGPLTLAEGDQVTALAAGLLASADAADSFRVLALAEGFEAPGADQAVVRIVHAGADAPTVDIDVGNDGSAELTGVARFAESGIAGVPLPADTALQVGIVVDGATFTAFTTPALPAGAELFVIATGLVAELPREAAGFSLLAVLPDSNTLRIKQNPVVFALHGSPDAPPVDIFAATAELVDDLSFGNLSAPLQVPPGAYTLDFFAHAEGNERPAGDPAASQTTPELAAGERYLGIAGGYLGGEPAFQLLPFGDQFPRDPAKAQVQVVHASPDAPGVDIGVVDGNKFTALPTLSGLEYPNASEITPVDPAQYTLGVAPAGAPMPIASFDVDLTAGFSAFAVALGNLLPASPGDEGFRLVAVVTSEWPWIAATIEAN